MFTRSLPQLHTRFRGAILGFAIGDALGFPLRGLSPLSIARMALLAEDFAAKPRGRFQKGQFSDDTQTLLAAASAVAYDKRVDGRNIAKSLLQLWDDAVILQPPGNVTESMRALRRGDSWLGTGANLSEAEPSCLSRGVVAGLFSDLSPPKLFHDVQVLTVMTHKSPLCTGATAAVARAIQLGLTGEVHNASTFCTQVAAAAALSAPALADEIENLPRLLAWDDSKALRTLSTIGLPVAHRSAGAGLSAHVVPVLLTALFAALKGGAVFRSAVLLALQAGGEVEVASGLAAAIVGAHAGVDCIPARLSKNVLYRDAILESADNLFVAWSNARPVNVKQMTPAVAVLRRR